ncbi:ATP-grasp domain-containing protein [Nocardioides ginsengisoli]|uniref:ATP-grasp domain-containing protein n=1 Tax=Nocardioides ginsengisoli TaxID=363868 RepID=A0ABW3W5J9_9ACTN
MTHVLITSAGQRVSLVRAFQHELRELDPDGQVHTCDLRPALSPACQIADDTFTVPRADDPAYVDRLLDQCVRRGISVLVPTIDTELQVLADARDRFLAHKVEVVVSSPELVATCRDKRRTNELFRARGIEVPRAIDRERPTYPLFVKPYDGSRSADAAVIRRPDELLDRHLRDERLMFMEYLDGDRYEEHTVDLYYDRGHVLRCVVPRRRLQVRAGEVSKALTCRNALVPFLTERLARLDGAVGCLTAQFFLDPASDRIVGIEINARFGGGFPLSYAAGANYPRWLLDEYVRRLPVASYDGWRDGLLMLRYDQEVVLDAAAARS